MEKLTKYEITYPPIIYGLMYACTIVFSLFLILSYKDNQLDLFVGIVFGCMVLLGICGVLGTHVWKIWVTEEGIIYRDYIGMKHYYRFSDVTRIDKKPNGTYVYYSEKKRMFKIDNNLPQGEILSAQLKANGVPCELNGMTANQFILKPHSVYLVISAMCIGTFALFLGILIKQNETANTYFIPLVIGLIISILVMLDLMLDKFSVNGNEIVRKRGVFTKRFLLNEIEYVQLERGLFRKNIAFYINGKCVTKVWIKNRPHELLSKRLLKEKIRYRLQAKKW